MSAEEQIQELWKAIQSMSQELQTVKAENVVLKQMISTREPPSPELPVMALSAGKFDGAPKKVKEFLEACIFYFTFRPRLFSTDQTKIGFIISNMTGNALAWVTPLVTSANPILQDFTGFQTLFKQTFERPELTYTACEDLLDIGQGSSEMLTYISEFKTLAAGAG
ncbi:protein LDOC1-like [Ambystoma mexicanum]|uniref:protein LDOC1-like n=1 Tax=Ambystoma mexicanum TaxID=8296 RepID=UPI0037E94EF3